MAAPTRIDDDLFAAAKLIAPVMSRSAAQQINHWARIGRELEAAKDVSVRRIAQVLSGARHYDDVSDEEQAIVRAEWTERIEAARTHLSLIERFAADGRAYVELDDHGNVVRIEPTTKR